MDRKGHDMRYAIDPTKIRTELGWLPETGSPTASRRRSSGPQQQAWWETIISGEYVHYCEKMYGNR